MLINSRRNSVSREKRRRVDAQVDTQLEINRLAAEAVKREPRRSPRLQEAVCMVLTEVSIGASATPPVQSSKPIDCCVEGGKMPPLMCPTDNDWDSSDNESNSKTEGSPQTAPRNPTWV